MDLGYEKIGACMFHILSFTLVHHCMDGVYLDYPSKCDLSNSEFLSHPVMNNSIPVRREWNTNGFGMFTCKLNGGDAG